MATKLPGIPAITTVQDATVAAILRPMKESIEILGSAVTGNAMASGQTASNTGSTTTTVTSADQDYTPPPAPTNLTAAGAFSNIIISWGSPTYSNHAYTEVWRSSTNVLGNATLIGFAPGRIFTDAVSVSTTFYYWVRFVSTANVAGPYNASLGTQAATATDPAFVIASLTGQITETQINATLNTRLNKIEALETTYGSTASAAQSAASAAQAASDAVAAKTAAILAQGGAETAKDSAVTAKTAAETAKASAQTAATNASSSATTAGTSAANAATSATAAANSATAAGNSASAAATSATNASTYATNAETASTASSTAKVAAESARDSAQTSATAAATSASTATTKASDAAQSATAASTSATNAATSASNASTSATNAATSATDAASSASSASTSATTAANSATAAGNSATSAATSATNASTYATSAETSSTAASTAKVAAESAKTAAETAKTGAETSATAAATSASTASTKATEASQSASSASTNATNAATSASNASTYATNASTSATNAAGSATSAANSLSSVQAIADGYNTTVNSAIQQRMIARAASDGTALAEYSVVTDVNGRIAGFGLGSEITASGGAAASTFGLRADKFYISPPTDFSQETQPGSATTGQLWYKPSTKVTYRYNGSAWVVFTSIAPFIVQTTTTTVNGVTVNPGVYMDAAYIKDGTITNVKIGNGAIDDAKIVNLDATKITTGYIDAQRIDVGSIDAKIANISAAKITSGIIDTARIGDGTITNAKIGEDIQSATFASNEYASAAPTLFYGILSSSNWTTWIGDTVTSGTAGAPGSYNSKKFTLSSGYVNGSIVSWTIFNVYPGQRLELGLSVQFSAAAQVDLIAIPSQIQYSVSGNATPTGYGGWAGITAITSFTGTTPVSTNEAEFVDLRGFYTVPATYTDTGGNTQVPKAVLLAVRFTAAPGTTLYVAKPFYMKDVPSSQTATSPYRLGRSGWRINKTGSALFNDAVIKSDIAIGASPYMNNGVLRGSGALINKDGTFAFGSSANNMIFDGTALTMNVPFIQNPKTISVSASVAAASNAQSIGPVTVAAGAEITIPDDSNWTVS